MSADPVQIRRYPNRRFYDRSRSRYVTLQEIEELVLQGQTIRVEDSQTGEDLTRQVLTQIMLERHPDKMELIPVAMLHSILRANDLVVDFWREYLLRSLTALENLQRSPIPLASPLHWMQSFFTGAAPAMPAPDQAADAVARRLAELEDRINRLEPRSETPADAPPRTTRPAATSRNANPPQGKPARPRRQRKKTD